MNLDALLINYKKGFNWLEKNYPIEFFFIDTYIENPIKWNAKLFLYKNNLKEVPKCKYCNSETKFVNITKGYRIYCSTKCLSNDVCIKNKRKETCIVKYGSNNPMENIEIANKLKDNLLNKYGVDNISKLQETKDKVKNSNLIKFGYEYNSQRPEIKKILSQRIINNKSIINIHKENRVEYIKEKIKNYNFDFINEQSSLYTFFCKKCETEFNIHKNMINDRIRNSNTVCTNCNPINSSISDTQNNILDIIKESYHNDIIKNCRTVINEEIDIYLPELKLGFEFNGIYWHSEKYRNRYYHLNKTKQCIDNGVRLIHIWEDDWISKNSIIRSQINNWIGVSNNRIYARKCEVKEIKETKICRKFLDDNHIQGNVNSVIKIGLYYENNLVSIMTFDHSEGRKKMNINEWNLSRFCNLLNTNVIGGASKLLNFFIKTYKPIRVISYADMDWSIGDLYNKLGFIAVHDTLPDYKYIINNKRIHKSRFRKSKLDTNKTETMYMKSNNIEKIWDCGKRKYELKITN